MTRIGKLFGIFSSQPVNGQNGRHEPGLSRADWEAIKTQVQGEVRSLVSKSIVESVFYAPPRVSYENREAVLQATANRLYADALFLISSAGAAPPFEPSEEVLRWVRDALDDCVASWRHDDSGTADGEYDPPIDAKRSTTDAIFAALERASQNAVLQEAAKQRVQAQAAMEMAE